MSTNFTGITFAEQKVTPSDDAIIRRAMLTDGILFGCELSYSGSTLTMASGYLLACGRQIKHPARQNWAVVDATSGYARLLLTVDLTRTATNETFDQVVDSIEYATAVDGFAELEQTNINGSGVRYQIEICKVALSPGGISGIESQLGPCEASGGGGLNFKLLDGLTQPSSAKENDIWVKTDTPINGYAYSAAAPAEPVEGMVWILAGVESDVAFSATKKQVVMLYPGTVKQYVGGAWVRMDANIRVGEEWVPFSKAVPYLYDNGDQCVDITGGWALHKPEDSSSGAELSFDATTMTFFSAFVKQKSYAFGTALINEPINISEYSTLKMIATVTMTGTTVKGYLGVSADQTAKGTDFDASTQLTAGTDAEYSLDISGMSEGSYYIGVGANAGSDTGSVNVVISEIWLE